MVIFASSNQNLRKLYNDNRIRGFQWKKVEFNARIEEYRLIIEDKYLI